MRNKTTILILSIIILLSPLLSLPYAYADNNIRVIDGVY
jgi:hypothetical protein